MRPFRFKQFSIEQSRSAMKVGTDGVVLGAWCNIQQSDKRVVDIGSGCGVIALMIAQRTIDTKIDGVEIEPESAAEAAQNFASSPWSDRLTLHNTDIQSFAKQHQGEYDHIVTNPPFFVDSLNSPDHERTIARHNIELPFEELIEAVDLLLNEGGRLSIILPIPEMHSFEELAQGVLTPTCRCTLYGREGGAARRMVVEFAKCANFKDQTKEETLTIENRDISVERYSEEYRILTHDFYLKF